MVHKMYFPNSPSNEQRQQLCTMIYNAFVEIRLLTNKGESKQAADLADAFHNLPIVMFQNHFRFSWFKRRLETYHEKYSTPFDYVGMLDDIVTGANGSEPPTQLI